jgi:hypothetical protein
MSLYNYELDLVEKLKEKYSEWENKWDYDDSQDPDILISPEKDIAIEWTDNGMYKISKSGLDVEIEFTDFRQGHTFGLYRGYDIESWQKYRELYVKASTSNAFRIDVPLSIDKIDFKGEEWEYHHMVRPGSSMGFCNFNHYDPEKLNLLTHLNQLTENYYQLMSAAKDIGDGLVPAVLIGNTLRDSEGFYFVRQTRRWDQDIVKTIDDSIYSLPIFLKYFLEIEESTCQQWKIDAVSKWESLK